MSRDPMLLLSIQVALLGAVVVIGFFYIWRVISRLEAKIEELSARECNNINAMCNIPVQSVCPMKPVSHPVYKYQDTSAEEDENESQTSETSEECDDVGMMRACFADLPIQSILDDAAAAFMMFKNVQDAPVEKEGVVLEELEDSKKPSKVVEADMNDASSGEETEAADITRTKLRKMTIDVLRDMCQARGLPTDGTKASLVERILASLPGAM